MHPGTLISALAPVLLVLGLGFAAGKHRSFDEDQAKGFSHLALTYALPAALFLSMAHFRRSTLIEQAPVALIMLAGYTGLYLLLYGLLRATKRGPLEAALLGYTFTSSSVPVFGLTVLTPIYGQDTGAAVVGLVSLITNLAQVSVAVFLMESAAPRAGERISVLQSIGRSAINPLVWAPVLGGVLAFLGLQLSPYVAATLEPLAAAAGGVAIFASGLVLAAHRVTLSPLVVIGSVIVMALQPALFFLGMRLGDISGVIASATVVAGAFPNATIAILFAQQYRTAEAETASIMLITTVGMIVAIPLAMVASAYL
jgi:malonate transporter and related proteins